MSQCEIKLSEFPFLTGCTNSQFIIPVLNYESGTYENYNIDFADFVCSINTESPDTYITGGTLSGSTLVLDRNDGVSLYISLTGITDNIIDYYAIISIISGATAEAVLYNNSQPTYVTIGGIEQGSTFSAVTMQDMWTDLLYPNLNPSFSNFYIFGYAGANFDVGYNFSADDRTFIWSTVNSTFITPNSLKIYDVNNIIYLATGLANDGTELVNIPYDIQKTIRATHTFRIYAQKVNNTWFYRDLYLNWYWRRYWGSSTNPNLINTEISGLTNNQLTKLMTGNYPFAAGGGYKYITLPASSGWINPDFLVNPYGYWSFKNPENIRDVSTNLNIALAGPSDGYTDMVNGLYCKLMSITNIYGYTETYRVYRTKYQLGGAITINVE